MSESAKSSGSVPESSSSYFSSEGSEPSGPSSGFSEGSEPSGPSSGSSEGSEPGASSSGSSEGSEPSGPSSGSSGIYRQYEVYDIFALARNAMQFKFHNSSTHAITITEIIVLADESASKLPSPPVTVDPDGVETFGVGSTGDLRLTAFQLVLDPCGTTSYYSFPEAL